MYDKVLDDKSPKVKQLYWNIAFGLQEVDGLKPSKYMLDLSKDHIKGKKTYYQVLDEITQKEIAKELGISRSYVSRIEKRALTKMLREFIKNKNNN